MSILLLFFRFFIDNQPAFAISAEDQQKMSRRTQRFGRQGAEDGNRNFSKKLSIDELLKSAVRQKEKERESSLYFFLPERWWF